MRDERVAHLMSRVHELSDESIDQVLELTSCLTGRTPTCRHCADHAVIKKPHQQS